MCVCTLHITRASSYLANSQRASLETWACAAPGISQPQSCEGQERNLPPAHLILLINVALLVVGKSFHRMTHVTQPLPHTWPRLSSRNTREVCSVFFLFSWILFPPGPKPLSQLTSSPPASTSTTSATQSSAMTKPAACLNTGKRQVETLLSNFAAQYPKGRVPARNARADLGGYRKSFNSSFRKASETISRGR